MRATFLPFLHSALLWLSQQENTETDLRVGDSVPLPSAGTWTACCGRC